MCIARSCLSSCPLHGSLVQCCCIVEVQFRVDVRTVYHLHKSDHIQASIVHPVAANIWGLEIEPYDDRQFRLWHYWGARQTLLRSIYRIMGLGQYLWWANLLLLLWYGDRHVYFAGCGITRFTRITFPSLVGSSWFSCHLSYIYL
jgi:hypothetical protein